LDVLKRKANLELCGKTLLWLEQYSILTSKRGGGICDVRGVQV
jgi:hypothetical protein